MTLAEFIENNDVDYSYNRISSDEISGIENIVGVSFGPQLKRYVVEYGYLGYKYIELFGVNSHQGINSDMVNKTLRLHKLFENTKDLIVIEDQGDGDFYLVDSDDMVYRFVAANNECVFQEMDLFEYILQRFLVV